MPWLSNMWSSLCHSLVRQGKLAFLAICALSFVAAGCSATHDWGDDHLVINELEILERNELWVELRDVPAEQIDCTFALCQNVLRGVQYEVLGDFDTAKATALDYLLERWVPTTEGVNPLTAESTHFQLRDTVEIDTTTGTAFMRLRFTKRAQVGPDEFRTVIGIAVSSDSSL